MIHAIFKKSSCHSATTLALWVKWALSSWKNEYGNVLLWIKVRTKMTEMSKINCVTEPPSYSSTY